MSLFTNILSRSGADRTRFALFVSVLLFFFVSGACGLLYQVVWTRKLVLLFGTTSFAVSTVLSIFFLGLGLGSLWGGRIADRTTRPLWVYGVIEIVVGLWAILFILLIDSSEAAVVGTLRAVGHSRALGIAVRAALACAFLIVPVTLMGATLPLLAKYVTRQGPLRGFRVGVLYSLNTFGAVVGCTLAGFYLLEHLGFTRATLVGAAFNIGIGIASLALHRVRFAATQNETDEQDSTATTSPGESVGPMIAMVAVFAFAVSGFCSLGLEVLWTRLLAIVFTGTTYAFTTMLTTVLCGIAVGSTVASALIGRVKHATSFFGIVQVLTGVACLFTLVVFPSLPDWLRELQLQRRFSWESTIRAKVFLSFLVLFPPTFFFGMSFPAIIRIVLSSHTRLGGEVGRVYSANTLGGVLGAIAGGFLIIPALGTHNGIVLLASLLCATGLFLLLICPTRSRFMKTALTLLCVAGIGGSVLALPDDVSKALNQWYVPSEHEVIYFTEGVEGTVVVTAPTEEDHGTDRYLWINAVQATASIEKGVKMNRFQATLPLLFDRDPKRALFMCFGSGVTIGTLALHDFERIDAIEISPDVLDAAELFATDNFDVRNNSRVHFTIDDGRNFLLTTSDTYDLITFEPMPLALSGVSTFYTKEYYELCRAHLNPGGLISQWVPLHGLNVEITRSLINTFLSVFPEANAWFINADVFLIGSNMPLKLDYNRIESVLSENEQLRLALADVNLLDLPEIMSSFIMNRENLAEYVQGAALMTDDRPWAEFIAPKIMYEQTVDECLKSIRPFMQSPTVLLDPEDYSNWETLKATLDRRHAAHVQDTRGLELYYDGDGFSKPEDLFKESLKIDPDDYNAKYYLAEIYMARARRAFGYRDYEEALRFLLEAQHYMPQRLDVTLLLADTYSALERLDDAARVYREYLGLGGAAERASEYAIPQSP